MSGASLPEPGESLEVSAAIYAALRQLPADADADGDSRVPVLVDCREEDEHRFCRIEGSVLLPLSEFAERVGALTWPKEQEIVVYCHHGMRSAQAATCLRRKGWERTYSLEGGIERWSTEIDPSVPRY